VLSLATAVKAMMHSGDGIVPGVAEEVDLAQQKGLPRFLVGGLGGLTRELSQSIDPSKLDNSLPDAVNMTLFRTDNVAACVNVLFEHLAVSESLAKSAQHPTRWNPERRAIVDDRDGRVDDSTSAYILRSY
jgi:hypothetical protein